MNSDQKGMLVAAPVRWDEACFAVPAIRALVESGLGVGILCSEEQRGFWQTLDGLEVTAFSPKPTAKPKQVAEGLRGKWQAALAWEDGLAAEAFQLAGIPRRLGPSNGKLKRFLTHPLGFTVGPLEHRVKFYLAAIAALGVETVRPEFFAPLAATPTSGSILLCPGSDLGASHEWVLERWLELGERLLEIGSRLTVASVDDGRALGKALATSLGGETRFFHASPLAGTLPLLAAHRLIIAADGSLPHLASHVGATCVVLFGPNDPAWKRPLGKRHAILRQHVECAPCLMAKCPLDRRCQNELSIERVWQAVLEKLA